MKTTSTTAGLVLLCAVGAAAAEPFFQTETIFPLQDKHVHGSSIVECPNGDLLACWFYGSGERSADDVLIQGARLRKGANEWSHAFVMADTPEFPDCNPVLYIDASDRLWLFWIAVLASRWECSMLKYRRAENYLDDGPPQWSWQDVIQLKPGDAFVETLEQRFKEMRLQEGMWAEYALPYSRMIIEAAKDPRKRQTGWMTRIHPLTLPSGRILLPLYSDGFNTCLMAISDDLGEHWRASLPLVGLGPIQPTLVRKKNGDVVAYLRDSGDSPGRIQMSVSEDDGESWSYSVDTELRNPGASIEAIALEDGRWLMVFNDTEHSRRQFSVGISNDEGKTWETRQIEPIDDEGQSFGYPSVIQTRDGAVHLTYSYTAKTGRSIRHGVIQLNAGP